MKHFIIITSLIFAALTSVGQIKELRTFDSSFNWLWNNSDAIKGEDTYRVYRHLKSAGMLASKYYYDKRKKHIKSISLYSYSCYNQFLLTFKENGDTFRLIDISKPIVLIGPPMPYINNFVKSKYLADSIIRSKFTNDFINNHIRFNVHQSSGYVYFNNPKAAINFPDAYTYYEELPRQPDKIFLQYDIIFNDTLYLTTH